MVALITGATGGIGKSVCLTLGKAGYDIIFTGIDDDAGNEVCNELKQEKINAQYFYCDATSELQVIDLFDNISKKYDAIDVIVNNVGGLGGRCRLSDMNRSFMKTVMDLNFYSAFYTTIHGIKFLKKGKNPSVINYSSIAVTSGGGLGASVYAASKAAIEGFTRGAAKDLAEFNIRVNAVSPGTIDTAFHSATSREVMETWKTGIVMKRFGEPHEVANVIEFLVSDKASFITGEVIQVNGGQAFI